MTRRLARALVDVPVPVRCYLLDVGNATRVKRTRGQKSSRFSTQSRNETASNNDVLTLPDADAQMELRDSLLDDGRSSRCVMQRDMIWLIGQTEYHANWTEPRSRNRPAVFLRAKRQDTPFVRAWRT